MAQYNQSKPKAAQEHTSGWAQWGKKQQDNHYPVIVLTGTTYKYIHLYFFSNFWALLLGSHPRICWANWINNPELKLLLFFLPEGRKETHALEHICPPAVPTLSPALGYLQVSKGLGTRITMVGQDAYSKEVRTKVEKENSAQRWVQGKGERLLLALPLPWK